MLIQTFQFTKADPSYRLKIQTALTIKPKGFFMKAKLRDPEFLEEAGVLSGSGGASKAQRDKPHHKSDVNTAKLAPMKILFGSNTGTCESLAQSLASAAPDQGFTATVSSLDDAVSSLSKDVPVVIFTASYEGLPPDNASHFVEWLTSSAGPEIKDVPFAVFGVGNSKSVVVILRNALLTPAFQRNGPTRTRRFPPS